MLGEICCDCVDALFHTGELHLSETHDVIGSELISPPSTFQRRNSSKEIRTNPVLGFGINEGLLQSNQVMAKM